ncbi:hypothetical protein OUZ56_005060 [Daphnia magna]|uniref:Uncharacterized protein n=1 Tax=Daphnia magna TaxID=35525 RepID=A0ABQ9YRP8_9CRUS|nr:hypothetical protein OUZ56_005060 [Daphnia magna]
MQRKDVPVQTTEPWATCRLGLGDWDEVSNSADVMASRGCFERQRVARVTTSELMEKNELDEDMSGFKYSYWGQSKTLRLLHMITRTLFET